MDFVDDDRLDTAEEIDDQFLLGLKHEKEAFRRRDQNFRPVGPDASPFRRRGIAASDGDSGGGENLAMAGGQFANFRQRREQIFANVVVKCFQWRDIDGRKLSRWPLLCQQLVDGPEKSREGFTAASWRRDEKIVAMRNDRP